VTAVFHHLAPNAKVVGIEHIKELAEWSKENLRKDGIQVEEGGVEIIHGDGRLGELFDRRTCSKAENKDRLRTVGSSNDLAYKSTISGYTRRSGRTEYPPTPNRSGQLLFARVLHVS
jgi:hypothetical protein